MQKNNIDISIIIVHYNVLDELLNCIRSVYESLPRVKFEIIVVDNDEKKVIEKTLKSKFPKVVYIKNKNNGWGGGTNKGLNYAKGKYIYLLNPDTLFINNALDEVYKFAEEKKDAGIVSSLLFDKKKNPYRLQGTEMLNPINSIFSISFINRFFPNNSISKKFWMKGWNKRKVKEVEVATLSASLIRKSVLIEAGKFDENFFLYYEEYDLCRRLSKKGYKNYIIPSSKVVHFWESSTSKTGRINEFIDKSRKYYFKKYYGKFISEVVDFFLALNKARAFHLIFLFAIFLLAFYLRFSKLSLVPFIGDQAWFFLSAKEIILSHKLPLLGIESSHVWLKQGPLWTYMIVPVLQFTNFNPIAGVAFSSSLGLLTAVFSYFIFSKLFTKKLGVVYFSLFATSPLIVFHSRFSYHTVPIPFLVIALIYAISMLLKGRSIYLPITLLCMSLLYNFELATVVFWPLVFAYILYLFFRKKEYFKLIIRKKILTFSLAALLLPMIPILIYDFQNGFTQTFVFAGWFGYKVLQIIGTIEKSKMDNASMDSAINFFFLKYQNLIFAAKDYWAYLVFGASYLFSFFKLKKGISSPHFVVFSVTTIGLMGYILSGVPSEAYLLMLFPGLIYFIAIVLNRINSYFVLYFALIIICSVNTYFIISSNYLVKNTVTLNDKIIASKKIILIADNKPIKLVYSGAGQKFASSVMPYKYLVEWLDKRQIKSEEKRLIRVVESDHAVDVFLVK